MRQVFGYGVVAFSAAALLGAGLSLFAPASAQEDKEAVVKAEIMRKCKAALEQGKPVRGLEFDAEQRKVVKTLGLITAKIEAGG